MRLLSVLVFAALVLAIAMFACGLSQPAALNWGALRDFNVSESFLSARTMLICGHDKLRTVANNALWEWNHARGKHHILSNQSSCNNRSAFNASMKVGFGYCELNVVGYHTQIGNHHDITICNGAGQQNWSRVMIHEVGHAYGLCDQYAPRNAAQIVFHPNCGWPRSAAPARSVMGGLYEGSPTTLTPDDIAGIVKLQKMFLM